MAQKIDQGAMAQSAHDKNIQARKDGGPGSGPKGGKGEGPAFSKKKIESKIKTLTMLARTADTPADKKELLGDIKRLKTKGFI